MLQSLPDLFYLSFATGAVVIAVFAFTQFNQPARGPSRALERLVRFLKTSDLRNRRVVWRAYTAYAAILLAIYVLICTAFTPPMLMAIGVVLPEEDIDVAQSPVVPLIVSLAMVGAAPAIRPLQHIEERIRRAAHYLSGIPAHLVQGSRQLQRTPLALPEEAGKLLLSDADWERLAYQRRVVAPLLDNPSGYVAELEKIHAYRRWILDHELGAVAGPAREGIDNNDRALQQRIDRLLRTLDMIRVGEAADPPPEPLRDLAEQTRELCEDVCAMFMLRVEHGLLDPGADNAPDAGPDGDAARQLLAAFLADAGKTVESYVLVGRLGWRAAMVAVVIAFGWGAYFAAHEAGGSAQVAINNGLYFAVTAIAIYALPTFAALALHDQAVNSGRWPSMATTHWTRWMVPVGRLFGVALLVALAAMLVVGLSAVLVKHGLTISSEYWRIVGGSLYAEGPRAVLGPILAIGIVALIDIARATREAPRHTFARAIAVTLAVLVIVGPATQALSVQYRNVSGYEECLERVSARADLDAEYCEAFRFTGWSDLVAGNVQELSLVGLRVLLIGGAVLFVCQATLAGQGGRHPAPARGAPA